MRDQWARLPDQYRWALVITGLTSIIFYICWYAVSHNIHTVISHLFYIPVVLACWRFPKPGIFFSLGIITGYIWLEFSTHYEYFFDSDVFLRSLIILFIGLVVAVLSLRLHNREKRFRRLLSAIDVGVIRIDRKGIIQYANPYAIHMLDREVGSLNGRSLHEFESPHSELNTFLERCLKSDQTETTDELVLTKKDGVLVPVLMTGYAPTKDELVLTLTDLSEEKWMAHELATGQMVMTTLIDAIPEGIFLSDADGVIIKANHACTDLTGWQVGTDLITEKNGLLSGESCEAIRQALEQVIHGKHSIICHLEAVINQIQRHYEITFTPIPDDKDVITRIAGIIHDITTRENYLTEIRAREEYLRKVLDGLPFATIVIGPDHTVLSVNQALAMLFEQEVEYLIGTCNHGHLLYPAEERPMLCDVMIEGDVDVLLEKWYPNLYRPSPTVPGAYEVIDFFPHVGEGGKWIMSTSARVVDEHGNMIGAIETFEDISSQKAAEEAIRISEERFKIASHIASDLIFEYDQASDRILWFGDIEKWLGLDSSARVSTLNGWTSLIHQDDVGKIKSAFIHHVLTGEPIREELRIKHRSGLYQTWIIKAVALYNTTNCKQLKTVGVVSDISEIRAIEEAKKNALITIEKYIEQFAVLNDHIRNPLQIIAGYNDLQGGEYATKIASQIAQINRIVDQLDKGWIESESIRDFLRRHYGISAKEEQPNG